MNSLFAIVTGGLFAAAFYLLLRRSLIRMIIGLALLGHAANLLLFTAAGLVRARPPLIPPDSVQVTGTVADPVPQALILTAIVIGFGVLAFALVLALRTCQTIGSDDQDELRASEE